MSYILVENLTKTVMAKTLLAGVGFAVNQGEKIALVAKNGTGKTTLLKILANRETYDSGSISIQRGLKIAYLAQEPELDLEKTIADEIFASDSKLLATVREYEESLKNSDDQDRMQAVFDAMNTLNAWEYEARIQEILTNLKLTELEGKIKTFSGGQRKRLALAKVLIDEADVLILDEPTNHLDIEMIDWLEEYLAGQNITLLLVTHDRYFLDKVCDQILELDKGKVYKHKGNYESYLESKETRQQNENINIDKTRQFLKKELEWVKKQPRGRLAKSTARVDAFYAVQSNLGQKHTTEKVKLDVISNRMGSKILELHNIYKSFGTKVILEKFSYKFKRGEKIGIIGSNGVGKTTFLNLIMGLEQPDSGNIVLGETITYGYYSQHQSELDNSQKVIDSVREIASFIKLSDGSELSAGKLLERFLFTATEQQNTISKLSGGEKKRLSLLRILMKNPNFLILDEPTNDFDLMTLDVLEDFLQNFKGCLIIISHDRYFMDSVIDHLFVFRGNGVIQDFPGNYSDYRDSGQSLDETMIIREPESKKSSVPESKPNELNDIYKEIGKLEKRLVKLNSKMFESGLSNSELSEIAQEVKQVEAELEAKNELWLELSV
jgi:ABC transport system ATP-binding/permease protein